MGIYEGEKGYECHDMGIIRGGVQPEVFQSYRDERTRGGILDIEAGWYDRSGKG